MDNTSLPISSPELLKLLDSLPYRKRVAIVAKLANEHKKNPELTKLIKDLRNHPANEGAMIEIEEGFMELLPPQKRDFANHYHEIQLSLVAAAASKDLLVLKEELATPSVNFKRFTAKEVVRQEQNDDWLFDTIAKSVRSVRKRLIHQCIRFRRVKVLDRLAVSLHAELGVDVVAHFLHSCSRPVVKEFLAIEEFFNSQRLHWPSLAKFHGDLILEMLRNELSRSSMYLRNRIWNKWALLLGTKGSRQLLSDSKRTLTVIDLFKNFPPVSDVSPRQVTLSLEEEKKITPNALLFSLPSIIQQNIQHFMNHRKFASRLFDAIVPMCGVKIDGTFSIVLNPNGMKKVNSDELYNYLKRLVALSTATTLQNSSNWDSSFLRATFRVTSMLPHFAYPQLVQLCDLILELFQKANLDDVATKRDIANTWLCYYSAEIVRRMYSAYVTAVKTNQPVELTAYEKLFSQILDKWLPLLVEKWQPNDIVADDLLRIGNFFKRLPRIPNIIAKVFNFFRPFICTSTIVPAVSNNAESDIWGQQKATRSIILESLFLINENILNVLRKIAKDVRYSMEDRDFARQQMRETIEAFWFLYKEDPIVSIKYLATICSYIKDANLRAKLWNDCFVTTNETLQVIFKVDFRNLVNFWANLRVKDIQPVLTTLIAESSEIVDLKTKDQLKAFQDLDDPKARKSLQKYSDSNSPTQRLEALCHLSITTIMAQSTVHSTRTLKFIQSKIKNETTKRRAEVLEFLIGCPDVLPFDVIWKKQKQKYYAHTYLRDDATNELFELWFTILSDALEAPDLFENQSPGNVDFKTHPVLKHFMNLSQAAFIRANKCAIKDEQLFHKFFNFAVELQWRIAQFCLGPKKAISKFKLDIDFHSPTAIARDTFIRSRSSTLKSLHIYAEPFKRDPERAKRFVNATVNAYTARFVAIDHKFNIHDRKDIFIPLFEAVGEYWQEIPILREHLEYLLRITKQKKQKDDEGLLILEQSDDLIKTFETVLKFPRQKHWSQVPVLNEYMETMLRSRQAKMVLKRWLYHSEVYLCKHKHRRDKAAAREANVDKLLSISKSSIYLNLVWRHLANNRQDRLDEFLGAQKTFRGVFYIEPNQRQIFTSATQTKTKRKAVNKIRKLPNEETTERLSPREISVVTEKIEKEKEREQKMVEEMNGGDHRDLWCFEGCFGMHKLLPRQSLVLAAQWKRQIFNDDRSVPERVKAMARWTLLPTTSYIDIVQFVNDNENKKLPVNLIETCLRGAMVGDEPTAALRWLLTPKFLSHDRARIAVYAIEHCVPHLPENALSTFCRIILTGQIRRSLKVTAYKEIIRLLGLLPTDTNIQLIMNEWNRQELHRDVSICIIRTAFKFLALLEKRHFAREILESVLTKHAQNFEVLATLLATKATDREIPALNVHVKFDSAHFCRSHMKDIVGDLRRCEIPSQERIWYLEKIVFPLAQLPSLAIESDLKWMAIYTAFRWRNYKKELATTAVKLLEEYLLNFNNKLWRCDKKSEREVHFRRCVTAATDLLEGCGITKANARSQQTRLGGTTYFQEHFAPFAHFINVANTFCAKIEELSVPNRPFEDTYFRITLIRLVEEIFAHWTKDAVGEKPYSSEVEKELLAPFIRRGHLFWKALTARQFMDFNYETSASIVIPFLQEVVAYTLNRPIYSGFVILMLKTYLQKAYNFVEVTYNGHLELHKIVQSLVNGDVVNTLNDSMSAPFALQLGVTALQAVPKYGTYSEGNLLQYFKRSLVVIAEVKAPWKDAYDPSQELLKTVKIIIDACCPNLWTGVRRFTEEINKFVNGLVQFTLEINNKKDISVTLKSTVNNFMHSLLVFHADFLAVACPVEVLVDFMQSLFTYFVESDRSHSLPKAITELVSGVHMFVDGVYNKWQHTADNAKLTEASKKTTEILVAFFALDVPATLKQVPSLAMRYWQLYCETGLSLLAEFRSFLWDHKKVARKFLQRAIPVLSEATGTNHLLETLSVICCKSYELTIPKEPPARKETMKELLNFLKYLLNDLPKKSRVVEHISKHVVIDMIVHFAPLTVLGKQNAMHPQLVALLESLYSDQDDSVKYRALLVPKRDFDVIPIASAQTKSGDESSWIL